MNGGSNGNNTVLVLYKVVNSEGDQGGLFNAFPIPRTSRGPTLATVKQNCRALHGLSHLGPEGYHWRVCVEDKAAPGETSSSSRKSLSWWDVQDENAVLPVKEASASQLGKIFGPSKGDDLSVSDSATKAAKGAFKSLGKALAGADSTDHGPPVCVIAFKLLDLVKVHDDFTHKNHGRGGAIPSAETTPRPSARPRAPPASAPPRGGYQASAHTTARPPQQQQQQQQHSRAPPPQQQRAHARGPAPRANPAQADLMGFGGGGGAARPAATLHHSHSMPTAGRPGETKQQKLKREYAAKAATNNRVWDDIDQRWIEQTPPAAAQAQAAGHPGAAPKTVGISLDGTGAIGKSANVAAAVNARVHDMKESQEKAVREVRAREEKKKADDDAEDEVRRRLEPKIKIWSEEHGKKKQLRALLGSLHTILWPEAKWKQVSIGDMLDNSKCVKFYRKATLVVHPDKTHKLNPEQRFLAKRIFDAITQAKTAFDNQKK